VWRRSGVVLLLFTLFLAVLGLLFLAILGLLFGLFAF
jgi:hypothetical protein